ncbi:methylated-DNA--[protein]-cysteine S-methyltransferase [Mesorhizobium sp. CAU 1741]|uniref:methylated-DNA--[protein]-cysteine S-methyltransferase n=1 Tax=Mesorhizobium sp. CAU 1741 TaxID=3140366 RepID=UPI00325A5980
MAGRLVFDTALGFVALAWSDTGLTRLALPQASRGAAERLAAKWTDTADAEAPRAPFVEEAMRLVRSYADGATVDFSTLPFDLSGIDPFRRSIYAAALKLRQGEVTTYGELAERAGFPKMARETGQALGRNPLPLVIPCHRILAAGGKIGGFSAPGGAATKERLLAHEGILLQAPAPAQAAFPF